jgi:hypothetical protein
MLAHLIDSQIITPFGAADYNTRRSFWLSSLDELRLLLSHLHIHV